MQIYVHSRDTRLSGQPPHTRQAVLRRPSFPQHRQADHRHYLVANLNYLGVVDDITAASVKVVSAVLVFIDWPVEVYRGFAWV